MFVSRRMKRRAYNADKARGFTTLSFKQWLKTAPDWFVG